MKNKKIIRSMLTLGLTTSVITAASVGIFSIIQDSNIIQQWNGTYVKNDTDLKENIVSKTNFNLFYGDTLYNYANYLDSANGPVFNGDLDSLQRTQNPWKTLNLWKNDRKSEQMVLVFDENTQISEVKVGISPINDSVQNGVTAEINTMNFIKSTKTNGTSTIAEGVSYFPDKIGGTTVQPNKYVVQPFLITFSSYGEEPLVEGNFSYLINIQYNVDGIYKNKNEIVDINTVNTTIKRTEDFSFNAMTSPATLSTYNLNKDNLEPNSKTQRATTPINPKPDSEEANQVQDLYKSNSYYFDWQTHNPGYFPTYLNDNYAEMYKYNYSFMQEMGAQYAYAPVFGNSILRISITNTSKYSSHEEYFNDLDFSKPDWFSNSKFEYNFDFDGFDKYLEFAINQGFTKIYMPSITRGKDGLKFFYNYEGNDGVSSKFIGNNNATYNVVSAIGTEFLARYGELTPMGQSYVDHFTEEYFGAIIDYVNNLSTAQKTTKYGTELQFYSSFDETKYEVNNALIEKLQQTALKKNAANVLKTHAYIGWQYDTDLKNYDDVYEKFFNRYDDITIQQRETIVEGFYDKEIENNLIKVFEERKKANKITWVYSSWDNSPATYVASLPAEAYWGMFAAEKYEIDGFTRFGYEGYRNSITSDGDVDNSSLHEPGDAYLMYPTYYLKNPMPSMRLLNIQESYNLVKKLRVLTQTNVITEQEFNKINEILVQPKGFKNNSEYMFANNKKININNVNINYIYGMMEYIKKTLEESGA